MSTVKLTNQELELRLKDFVSKERFLLHIILDHIKEVDRRKLYLERAYSSLYEYLVKELGYSGSAAIRRQEAARMIVQIPELGHKIQSGSINLTQICELSRAIKLKEKLKYKETLDKKTSRISLIEKYQIISNIEGKSNFETQQIISNSLSLPLKKYDVERSQKDQSMRLEITFTKDQYAKLLQCKEQAAQALIQKNENPTWGSVLTYLSEHYLKINKSEVSTTSSQLRPSSSTQHSSSSSPISRPTTHLNLPASKTHGSMESRLHKPSNKQPARVTKEVRNYIINRDLNCQYKDPQTQKKCRSTFALQVDHKIPIWTQRIEAFSEIHKPENLQVLCAHHNRYKYQKECHAH